MSESNTTEDVDRPADARDDGSAALADFLAKWRGRWPEWNIAEAFVPADQRDVALAWATLQQELVDAAWGGSDPIPGKAKLGWWQEELSGWTRGARRHPLATVLQAFPAPWQLLANALPALADARERPASVAAAFDTLEPFATAVAQVDNALFDTRSVAGDGRVVAANLLHWRMAHEGDGGVPLDMLARAADGHPVAVWAAELGRQWPMERPGSRVRRIWAALARKRLAAGAATAPLPAVQTLWIAWRSARD
ncbi:squalene/phytoene synthase family protein [Lysobacter sp. A03]|uniref:squalene/phytoene synthase family protein n=1 Tax=Lysobacter sp. A03 TaxID=1199154 RepID=UPI0005B727DA|nr:squalene/phytoene synthase family protein [Lysobacter sp. A03]KIQ96729.1 Phytoene/squalene synthetase [Lysobacter sp. A03]